MFQKNHHKRLFRQIANNLLRKGVSVIFLSHNELNKLPENLEKFSELTELMANHSDFKSAIIPDINELKKIYDSDTKLHYVLMRNSLVVWSSTINPNGNIQCLNFRTGEIIEKSPDSNNHFVPIVKLLSK